MYSLFDMLDTNLNSMSTGGYPPYNIKKEGDYKFSIEIALAGFGKDDIEVKVAESELSVKSVKENKDKEDTVYRGISYRKFDRRFALADDIQVIDASLEHGMLTISLERIIPEEKKPRLIKIK
jgi:molecular chaperone IbpA